MIIIDGSKGEGGGQILRTSVALSAITQEPLKVINIRRSRPKPGLAAQHLTGIKAVSELCGADIGDMKLGDTELVFNPGKIKGGDFKFDIGTAGSITLVLQAFLPPALMAEEPTTIELTGGTDVKFAPPIDYFRFILKPLIEVMGADIKIDLVKRGYYPKGGGKVIVNIEPAAKLNHLELSASEEIDKFSGIIHSANLPEHITRRLEESTQAEFISKFSTKILALEIEHVQQSLSPGVGITMIAEGQNRIIGSSALGERGIPAERLARNVVLALHAEIEAGATVDSYASDQLLVYLGLSTGTITVRKPLTNHTRTNIDVIEQFYGKIFNTDDYKNVVNIRRM
jgi:RNA 3'-phosphate cyclase